MSVAKNMNYSPIALGEIDDTTEEWLKWREHGPHHADPFHPDYIPVAIGGSAVSILFGENPWTSKLELFHQKSGMATPKYAAVRNEERLTAGHKFEAFVAEIFKDYMRAEGITDVEVWKDWNMYQHPLYKFALCNLDRRIKVNGVPGILECKTTGSWDDIKNYWQKGIVPKKYEYQCRYYMATMNLSYCYICCCWGFTLKESAVILIKRDLEIEEMMMETVADFVEHCVTGIEPDMQDGHYETLANYYTRLYGEIEPSAPAWELPDTTDVYELISSATTLFERKTRLEQELKEVEQEGYKIASFIMQLSGGKASYATYRIDDQNVVGVKLKIPMKRASFDEDRLKAEKPTLYDKYLTPAFDVTKFKKENKALAAEYAIPAAVNPEKPITLDSVTVKTIPA